MSAFGQISRKSTTDDAVFTATSRFKPGVLPEIPMTGGTGTAGLTLAGLGVLAAVGVAGWRRRSSDSQASAAQKLA